MSWLLILAVAWVAVAVPLALVLGRSIRVADQRDSSGPTAALPDFVPAEWTAPAAEAR